MHNKNASAAAALVVACLVWAWAFGWFQSGKKYNDDPTVAKLEKLMEESAPKMEQLSRDERRTQRQAFEKQMEGLTSEQRMAVFESSLPFWMPMAARRFEQEYDKFMAKSPEEQRKEIDKRIDEMEARGGQRDGGPPNIDPKRADAIRKKMLALTTPEQRAKFEHGIQMVNDRRKERGLPPMPGPGGGFF